MNRHTIVLLAAALCSPAYGAGPKGSSTPNGYAIQPAAAADGFEARNQAHGFVLRASEGDTVIDTAGGAVSLTLQAFGWGSEMQSPGAVTQANSSGHRLDRKYATGIAEWLDNTANGLEQGFVVASRPAGAAGPLRIRLETGWRTAVAPNGQEIVLTRGDETLTYAGLKSWDARGVEVESRMLAVGTTIEIEADDANAVYPVTVDPTLVQQQKFFTPSGEDVNGTHYGLTVALSNDGNTALVGGDAALPVLVLTRSQGTWTEDGTQLPTADGFALSGDGRTAVLWTRQSVTVCERVAADWSTIPLFSLSGDSVIGVALSEDGTAFVISTLSGIVYSYSRDSLGVWTFFREPNLTGIGFPLLSADKTTLVFANQSFIDVFRKIPPATDWSLESHIIAGFLSAAALSGDGNALLLGSTSSSNQPSSARLLTRTGLSWSLVQTITNQDPNFGVSVALSRDGSTAVVGASSPLVGPADPGSAYLYVRTGQTFQLSQTLTPADRQPGDAFGSALAISQNGSTVLVGAPRTNNGLGAAYFHGSEAPRANPSLFIMSDGGSFYDLSGAGCTQPFPPPFLSGTPLTVLPDAACTLQYFTPEQFRPGSRYAFDHWQDDNSTNPVRSITTPPLGGSAYYFAVYRTQHELTAVAGTGGTVSPSGFFDEGTSASVSATPSPGYQFLNFTETSDGGTVTHTTNPLTVVMDRPRAITANFEGAQPVLAAIELAPNVSVVRGGTVQLGATGRYTDNSTATLTGQVTWNSANTAIATVSPGGLATGVALGSSDVTASLDGVTSNTMVLNVTPPQLVSINISAANTSLPVGTTTQFTATGSYSDGSTAALTSQVSWTVLPTGTTAFAISNTGLASAVSPGSASIQASLSTVTSNTVVLTATAPALVSILAATPRSVLPRGSTVQLTATGTYTDGTTAALTGASWTSSNPASVTISLQGLATAVSQGTATIRASFAGIASNGVVLNVPNGSPLLSPVTILSKTNGTAPNERVWTIQVTNGGNQPATNLRITGVTINSASPAANLGLIALGTTAFPVAFPATTLNPGASTSAPIRIVFPPTTPPTRISITISLAADGGYTSTATLNNQMR